MTTNQTVLTACVFSIALFTAARSGAQFGSPNRAFHAATPFRLDGKHQAVACEACHLKGQFRGTPNTCFDCHWVRRKDDRFQTRLGSRCEACHKPTAWTAVTWNHAAQTGVSLNGAHRNATCDACHAGGSFKLGATNCASCHQKDFDAATSPNHKSAGFPQTCDVCHKASDTTWHQARFAHTWFPLRGAHNQSCETCHTARQNFAQFSCTTCHGRDTDREHRGVGGYRYDSAACYSCHPTGRH